MPIYIFFINFEAPFFIPANIKALYPYYMLSILCHFFPNIYPPIRTHMVWCCPPNEAPMQWWKISRIIKYKWCWNAKSGYYVFLQEVDDFFIIYLSQGNLFWPLNKIMCRCQNISMLLWWVRKYIPIMLCKQLKK